jgi:hypothetical protein
MTKNRSDKRSGELQDTNNLGLGNLEDEGILKMSTTSGYSEGINQNNELSTREELLRRRCG